MNALLFEPLESRRLCAGGQFDPTFGAGGISTVDLGSNERSYDLLAAPGGKMLAIGTGDGNNLRVTRLNSDGLVDKSFAAGGFLQSNLQFLGVAGVASDAIESSTGRFAVAVYDAGFTNLRLAVFTADGALDKTFDGDGIKAVVESNYQRVGFQPGGKLIVAGIVNGKKGIHRFNANGSLDTTFGDGGSTTFAHGTAADMVVAPDGTITVAASEAKETLLWLWRFKADGALAAELGPNHNGVIVTAFGRGIDMDVGPDGSVAYASTGDRSPEVLRFEADGTPTVNVIYLQDPAVFPLQVQADGAVGVIVLETYQLNDVPALRLARYTTAGLDRGYGVGGYVPIAFGADGLLVTDDGAAFVAGGVARKLSNGVRNTDFRIAKCIGGQQPRFTAELDSRGTLTVTTADDFDAINIYLRSDGRLMARNLNDTAGFRPGHVKRIVIFCGGGNDGVSIDARLIMPAYIDGGVGNDSLHGGSGADQILGGLGNDEILGFDGNDTLQGGSGNDYIIGGAGSDDLYGNGGRDTLSGAGGNDRLFGGPNDADWIKGGAGNDAAAKDDKDHFDTVEKYLV